MAPQYIPRAVSVLTLGNKVVLYCMLLYVHRDHKEEGREPRTATSTFTQLLSIPLVVVK